MDLEQNEWRQKMAQDDKAVVLDVRTPMECDQGVIPNAVISNIMEDTAFQKDLENFDPSKTYYVYCRSGARSGHACQQLQQRGVKCFNLKGGMMAWTGELTQLTQH